MYKDPQHYKKWTPTSKDYVMIVFGFLGALSISLLSIFGYLPALIACRQHNFDMPWYLLMIVLTPIVLLFWNVIISIKLFRGRLNEKISRFRFETLHITWFWIFNVLSFCMLYAGLSFFDLGRCR